jgi:hypothetical protein
MRGKQLIPCEICGKLVKAQGIGTHMRLKHEIVIKTIVREYSLNTKNLNQNSSSNSSKNLSSGINLSSNLSFKSSKNSSSNGHLKKDESLKELRPSDYRKKNVEVIKQERYSARLQKILSGIYFPSIPRWKQGKLTDWEKTEIEKTASQLNKTFDEYMQDLENSLKNCDSRVAQQFYYDYVTM